MEQQKLSPVCQSCGMPLTKDEYFGTNADNSANTDYCIYCFKNGKFAQDCTMDEMIEHCVSLLDKFNEEASKQLTREESIKLMKEQFPNLKRWKK